MGSGFWERSMNHFKHLNKSLEILGFSTYEEYLNSDVWKKIRKKVLKRNCYKCQACGSVNNLNVHHTRYGYKVLQSGKGGGLYVLCNRHHKKVHQLVRDNKSMSLRKATREVINKCGNVNSRSLM